MNADVPWSVDEEIQHGYKPQLPRGNRFRQDSPEEQQLIDNLTAKGWMLYARPDDVGKPGYVRLMFWKPTPIVPQWVAVRS